MADPKSLSEEEVLIELLRSVRQGWGGGLILGNRRLEDVADEAADRLSTYAVREKELETALEPFADLADYISEKMPHYDTDHHEVQIEGWPYTLSVGWLRKARALRKGEDRG